jgi:hypothetical protein
MKYKNAIIAFAVLLLFVLFIRQIAHDYEIYDFKLEGTYSCSNRSATNAQTLDWFSFERDGSNKFRYYSMATSSQAEDIGTFKKVSDRNYILSSAQLHNVKIVCYKKFPNTVGFRIILNGAEYSFIQTSIYPTQILPSGSND